MEERLSFYDTGVAPKKNIDVMREAIKVADKGEKKKKKKKDKEEDEEDEVRLSSARYVAGSRVLHTQKHTHTHAHASPSSPLLSSPLVYLSHSVESITFAE